MIRRFSSDLASFKTLTFKPGLNILLADKSAGASDRQSRNGAGKTSFIELVHFLFGADARKEGIFRSPELTEWTFDVAVDIAGQTVSAARSGARPSRIMINGDVDSWPIQPQFNREAGLHELSNENLKANLGALWFGLPIIASDEAERFQPSFRSLFSYFARRQNDGGFQRPMQYATIQPPWNPAGFDLLPARPRLDHSGQVPRTAWTGKSRPGATQGGQGRRSRTLLWTIRRFAHTPHDCRSTSRPTTRTAYKL